MNQKQHNEQKLNVTQEQLEQINDIIELYDCNYMSLLLSSNYSKNFHILYNYGFQHIYDTKCKTIVNNDDDDGNRDRINNRHELVQRIVTIVTTPPPQTTITNNSIKQKMLT